MKQQAPLVVSGTETGACSKRVEQAAQCGTMTDRSLGDDVTESTAMRTLMRQRAQSCRFVFLRFLLILTSVSGLVLIPIDYRGGSESVHSHALLHFVADIERGTLNHHLATSGHHSLNDMPDQSRKGPSFFSPEFAFGVLLPPEITRDQPDLPTLSSDRLSVERGLAIGDLSVITVLLIELVRGAPIWLDARSWRALSVRPATPPPRLALA